MYRLRQHHRLNRTILLALVLLISNVAAMSCAMAISLCIDCPEHPPVVCAEPCVESDAMLTETSPDESNNSFRPMVFLPALATVDNGTQFSAINATSNSTCELPSLPLRLRFCVFLK